MIRIHGLRKTYRTGRTSVTAVDGVDLDVAEGEVFGVLGRSGAGKSTLLRCTNLLERPDEGTVTVDGTELTALQDNDLRLARQHIGMIHQHFALLGSRTAAGNVSFPLEIMGVARAERTERVAELLSLVGLEDRADAHPAQLSGGQKQRVGIARALAGRPQVLLSDEATSALDPETTGSILELLQDLNRRLGLTILLITHEMPVIKRICDSAAVMREGRLVESGRLRDLLGTPGSELARELFPLGRVPVQPVQGNTVVDVTFAGDHAGDAWISALSRRFDMDVRILAGATETVAGIPAGRLRVELPAGTGQVPSAVDWLEDQGLIVEVAR